MEKKTIKALLWIHGIFEKHKIEYEISGGFAAKLYGSPRSVNDIDIEIPESFFHTILPDMFPYLTFGPARYKNEKWDCELMKISYEGQDIDISGSESLKISSKDRSRWINNTDFSAETLPMNLAGINLNVIHPRVLIAYKRELDGDHQLVDISAAEAYLSLHGL